MNTIRHVLSLFFFLFAFTVMFLYARYMIFRDFAVVVSEIKDDTSPDEEQALSEIDSGADGTFDNPSEEAPQSPSDDVSQ